MENFLINVCLCFLIAFVLTMFSYLIYTVIINESRFKTFRENLKVGDETSDGVVIAINGYNVTTEKITRIEQIYPYDTKK